MLALSSSSLRVGSRVALWLVAVAAVGCTDPQGGSQIGHDRDETAGNPCEETVTVIGSLEEETPLGFTGGAVLAQAEGTFESPIVWLEITDFGTASPETGEGSVSLAVRHTGGEIRSIDSKPKPPTDGSEGGLALAEGQCVDRVEVDVELTITTSGGALAETVTATLSTSDPRHVNLDAELDPAALAGSLVVTPSQPGWVVEAIGIHGGMAAGTSWGAIDAFLTFEDGDVVGAGNATLARWPTAESCSDGGVPLPLDATLFGFTAADAVATADGTEATLTWDDGATTTLSLGLVPSGTVACVAVGADRAQGIAFPARLSMISGDERIDGGVDVQVFAAAGDDGELGEITVTSTSFLTGVAPADFESTFGVTGFDVTGYDEAALDVNGLFTGGQSTGAIQVIGLTIPDCVSGDGDGASSGGDSSGGAPGCEGVTATELGGATWATP